MEPGRGHELGGNFRLLDPTYPGPGAAGGPGLRESVLRAKRKLAGPAGLWGALG